MERLSLNEFNRRPEEKEVVIAAAVKADDETIFSIEGKRHHEIFQDIREAGKALLIRQDQQGFVTSTGRYVDRKEALEIQKAAGIESVDKDGYRDQLYSEDIF